MSIKDNNVTIELRYGELDSALEWCKESCIGDWNLAQVKEFGGRSNGVYEFTFADSRDVILFQLRWG